MEEPAEQFLALLRLQSRAAKCFSWFDGSSPEKYISKRNFVCFAQSYMEIVFELGTLASLLYVVLSMAKYQVIDSRHVYVARRSNLAYVVVSTDTHDDQLTQIAAVGLASGKGWECNEEDVGTASALRSRAKTGLDP